jgi:4-amino-4-deoxy-L-arabinose transferase-like glycosyltransferase
MGTVGRAEFENVGSQPRRDLAMGAWFAASLGYAVAALALCFATEPLDHGYTRYATIAFEMVRSGDWIAPHLDGRLYVNKPPLAMWGIAAAMALTNSTAGFTQHAPNVVALLLSVLFLRRLGARIFGRADAGWLAAGLYVSALLPFALLRDKRIDPLFTAFLLGAFDFLHAALASQQRSRARLRTWLGAAGLLAAATLTKGPLALAFFVTIALAAAAWTRRLRALASLDVLAAATLYCTLVALWPLAMIHDGGFAAWSDRLAERDLVSRFAGPLHYVANLPLRLAPWALLLPALALALRPLLRGEVGAALRLPVTWFSVVFVLLHVTSAKHSRYLLPAFPAALLLCVALWITPETGAAAVLSPRARKLRDGALTLVLALGALAGVAAPLVPLWVPAARSLWPSLALGGALAAIGGVAALRKMRAGADPISLLASAIVVVLLIEAGVDLLRSAKYLGNDDLPAARIALADVAAGKPTLLLQLHGDTRNAMLLTTRRPFVLGMSTEDARRFAQASGDGIVVAKPEALAALRAEPDLAVGEVTWVRLAGRQLALATIRAKAIEPRAAAPEPILQRR